MTLFDLEYTLCLIQRDVFSFAAKSHREEEGDPTLRIDVTPSSVIWELRDLDHGVPQAIAGISRVDRIDFYFRREVLQDVLPGFPPAGASPNSALRLPPTSSAGTERREGKRVRIVAPICRFYPLDSATLIVDREPRFEACGTAAYLHLDIETGPARIYGSEIFEVHFGVQADFAAAPLEGAGPSRAILTMTHELYASIVAELPYAVR